MGLIADFATWTEKTRRKLLRESDESGKVVHDQLPPGVPVSVPDALDFIEALLAAEPPAEIADKAEKWKEKLCRTPQTSKHGPNSRR